MGRSFSPVNSIYPPPPPRWFRLLSVLRRGFAVIDSLSIVTPIVYGSSLFGPCFKMQYLVSFPSFAIILMGKRASCLNLIGFLMSSDSPCSVDLPRGAGADPGFL